MKNKVINFFKHIKLWEINILFLLTLSLLFSQGWKMDVDSWFILNTGRYIYSNGFTNIEPFTIHQNLSYSAQQWLYTVIIWPLFHYIGAIALVILEIILFLIIYLITYKLCNTISQNNKKISAIISSMLCLILVYTGCITMRPQMFTFINILLYLTILENFIKKKNWKILLWMIPISILEINIHAALWWMLFIFTAPFIVELIYNNIVKKEKNKNHIMTLIFISIIAFFCGLINPYGIKSILYFPLSYNDTVSNAIVEMSPLNIFSINGIIVFTILIIYYFINMKNYSKTKEIKLSYMLLLFGTFILTLKATKCLPLYIITTIYPLAYYLKDTFKKSTKVNFKKQTSKYKIIYALIILAIIVTTTVTSYKKIDLTGKNHWNESIIYLKEKYGTENITLYVDWPLGSYAEYEGFKCYIDSRVELFYKSINKQSDIFDEYYKLQNGKINPQEFINKYKFTHVIAHEGSDILYNSNSYDNYHILYETEKYKIFERNDFNK